jgi:apolipoprotein N-acyltransferase
LCAGLIAGLAHPPFGLLPGLLGYALLLSLLDTQGDGPRRSAFLRGWLAGLGYFLVSVWWIAEPLLTKPSKAWLAPFVVLTAAAGLAVAWGGAALAYRALAPRGGLRVLVFAGCLTGFEWLRGHLFTGLPWDLPGETWRAGSEPSQMAAVAGAYGLTWITVAIAAAPAMLLDPAGPGPGAGRLSGTRWFPKTMAAAVMIAALACLYAFGLGRLSHAAAGTGQAPTVRVVQTDIASDRSGGRENLDPVFDAYLRLSRQPATISPDLLVWPEDALPALADEVLAPEASYGPRLTAALEPGQTLLMGARRAERQAGGQLRYFNSLVALRREGQGLRVTGVYDKQHLSPLGEFTPGGPARPLAPWGAPALLPLIGHEALFPGFGRQAWRREGVRPAWILNISDDHRLGVTSGPWQQLNVASYRAIEEGLPMVRATPTGVSAIIDSYGRIAPGAQLGPGGLGVIDAPLPPALTPTPFGRLGDLPLAGMLLLSALAALASRRIRRTR